MKIQGSANLHALNSVNTARTDRARPEQSSSGSGDAVSANLSPEAAWLSELKAQASEPAPIRTELVEEVRAQLADGTFEDSVDMDRVLDSLLAEF